MSEIKTPKNPIHLIHPEKNKRTKLIFRNPWILKKKHLKKKQELSTLENHRPLFKNIPLKMINSPGKIPSTASPDSQNPQFRVHLLLFFGQLCSTHRPGSSTPIFSISTQVPISKRKKNTKSNACGSGHLDISCGCCC